MLTVVLLQKFGQQSGTMGTTEYGRYKRYSTSSTTNLTYPSTQSISLAFSKDLGFSTPWAVTRPVPSKYIPHASGPRSVRAHRSSHASSIWIGSFPTYPQIPHISDSPVCACRTQVGSSSELHSLRPNRGEYIDAFRLQFGSTIHDCVPEVVEFVANRRFRGIEKRVRLDYYCSWTLVE